MNPPFEHKKKRERLQVGHPWVGFNRPASAPSLAAKGEFNKSGAIKNVHTRPNRYKNQITLQLFPPSNEA